MRKTLLVLTLGLFTGTAFAAGEHGGSHAPAGDAEIDRTIRLEAGDMWFDAESLNVAPGHTIRFEITNTGNLAHEFVIGDAEAQAAHREMMRQMSGGHDDQGHGGGGHGDGGHHMAEGQHGGQMPAVTLAPGERATLVWTVPAHVDRLEYACNLPGHYEAGMSGHIDLQE
ncbi:plastocyanin/azurin family copper-binding protein [Halomonas saccharevitans]|uniref:Plastocyanin/azurin family copper-binding protein n=1 Tax=Halomonas saccharevitans TaxID=416872 RepID=A0ABU3NGF7_9GAMM|nr:plastocyanin/azurin family copper-binding protein [Halomonas saccharevitans]MDT8879251.1 plastocyanin/azurin family copper-binding protein [Halomonas saccharevitans]